MVVAASAVIAVTNVMIVRVRCATVQAVTLVVLNYLIMVVATSAVIAAMEVRVVRVRCAMVTYTLKMCTTTLYQSLFLQGNYPVY